MVCLAALGDLTNVEIWIWLLRTKETEQTAKSQRCRSMNRVAVGDYELILLGFDATPWVYYFKLLKPPRIIRFEQL